MDDKDKWGLNWNVWVRDRFRCFYCGFDGLSSMLAAHQFAVDHIRPVCYGRDDSLENLVTACCSCNGVKGQWDRSHYDPEKFKDKSAAEVRDAAKAYVEDYYRKWDSGYREMMRLASCAA